MTAIHIENALLVRPGHWSRSESVLIEDGRIVGIGSSENPANEACDRGLY